jgi:tyrosine aminotransferase
MSSWNEMKHEPAARTNVLNPIRVILERDMKPPQDHPLPMINLGLGEPSKAHGYTLPAEINQAMIAAVNSETANGYGPATGSIPAREAVAKKFSTPEFPINPNNVIMSFGCSGALYNAIAVLCEAGSHLLVASPGFPLCQPIC